MKDNKINKIDNGEQILGGGSYKKIHGELISKQQPGRKNFKIYSVCK